MDLHAAHQSTPACCNTGYRIVHQCTSAAPLQADHAFHEEHEGTDMRLGEAYQARLPDYYGPLELLGEQ